MSSFEEINIGDTLGPLELFVSKDQCRAYAKLMGMGEIAGRFTDDEAAKKEGLDRKSTRLNSSHLRRSRMPSSA